MRKATSSEGEYLPCSIAATVWRVTPTRSPSLPCVILPARKRSVRMSLVKGGVATSLLLIYPLHMPECQITLTYSQKIMTQGTEPLLRCNIRRSEEHTSELQSLMRISYAVFCLKKKR